MSSIILKAVVVLSSAMLVLSLGCSDARTPKSLINPDTGQHDAGWASPDSHGAVAKAAVGSSSGFAACQECHADNFIGGISSITCLNTAGCHGASVSAPHSPKPWRGGTRTHTNTDQSNAPICALCHTNGANSSVQPSPFDPGAAPGCFNNTLCHAAVGHPAGWSDPSAHGTTAKSAPTSTTGFSYCQTCHGNDFTGGTANQSCFTCHQAGTTGTPPHAFPWLPGDTYVHSTTDQGNAPVCGLCHLGNRQPPAYVTLTQTVGCFDNTLCHATPTCGTCHGIPPNGAVSPNVAGQHAPHSAVSTIIVCATCHMGAGYGTALHQNGVVDVIIDPTYNAKSGTASYNATANTCSNVSCHGGQTTPGWLSGTVIDVNTQCTSCHASGTAQYNSYNSGQHSLHVSFAACTECHDTTKLASVHFNDLNTTTMSSAYQTVLSTLNYTGTATALGQCGNFSCHGEDHTPPRQW